MNSLSKRQVTISQSVAELKQRLSTCKEDAKFALKFTQARQSAYNAKRFTPPSYNVGNHIFFNRKLFTTAALAAQPSMKLKVKWYRPFKISELIGQNAVKINPPDNNHIHPVVHVKHTTRVEYQPAKISQEHPIPSHPFTNKNGELVQEESKILSHKTKGKNFHFSTLYKEALQHRAERKPLNDLVDEDGTISKALHGYMVTIKILHCLH